LVGGFVGKILKVDLTRGKVKEEKLGESFYREWLGGYGLGARIIYSEIKPKTDPLGPENIFGLTTGLLTGTTTPATSVTIAVAKSPLTGTWGDTSAKAFFASELKFAGFDDVFFYGKSRKPVYLWVNDGKAEIKDASDLYGRDTFETQGMIREKHGDRRIQVMGIGQAGEKLSKIACIVTEGGHAAGRSGLGAVMGSKNLKAVAVRGTRKIQVADSEKMTKLNKEALKTQLAGPFRQQLNKYGTCGDLPRAALIADAPIKNWAGTPEGFPTVGKIGGDEVIKYKAKSYTCFNCSVGCDAALKVEVRPFAVDGHKPEYETMAAFGTMLVNDSVESIIYANNICDRYGLDTISAGCTIAFAMECYEKGLITKKDTGGIELTWGNAEAIVEMTEKMARREGFGDVLADGVKAAAEKIGKGSEKYAMHVGGQEVPMHDPRVFPGLGTGYISDATPGRHTAPNEWGMSSPEIPGVETVVIKERFDASSRERALVHAITVKWGHATRSLGICNFGGPGNVIEFVKAATGWDVTGTELLDCGERIACIRQAFNVREGFRPSGFKLPDRIIGKPPFKTGPTKDITVDPVTQRREYFKVMDWSHATGKPSKKRMVELGLEDVAKDLYP